MKRLINDVIKGLTLLNDEAQYGLSVGIFHTNASR